MDVDWCHCRTVSRAPGVGLDGAWMDTKQDLPGMDRLDRPPGRWGSPTRSVACGRNRAAVPGGVGRRAVPMLPKEQRYSTTTNIVGSAGCRRWVGDIVPVSVKTWLGIGLVSHSPETCRYVGIASVRWSFGQLLTVHWCRRYGLAQPGRSGAGRRWQNSTGWTREAPLLGATLPPTASTRPGIPGCPDSAMSSVSSKDVVAFKTDPFPSRSWAS